MAASSECLLEPVEGAVKGGAGWRMWFEVLATIMDLRLPTMVVVSRLSLKCLMISALAWAWEMKEVTKWCLYSTCPWNATTATTRQYWLSDTVCRAPNGQERLRSTKTNHTIKFSKKQLKKSNSGERYDPPA